jgi:hypothetical protein
MGESGSGLSFFSFISSRLESLSRVTERSNLISRGKEEKAAMMAWTLVLMLIWILRIRRSLGRAM